MTRALIPNSTQIPDIILDHWMADLSGAELKVLLYVARRTYGFGKESDNISINQMAGGIKRRDGSSLDHGTGLSRSGVKSACNGLIQRGILVRVNNRSPGGLECEESTYRLNLFAAPEGVGQKKAYLGQKKAQVGQKNAGGRPKIGPTRNRSRNSSRNSSRRGERRGARRRCCCCLDRGTCRTRSWTDCRHALGARKARDLPPLP